MRLVDLFHETWYALTANKGRSFLTILGIVIGISAVITMTSLIGGMQNALIGSMGLSQSREIQIAFTTAEDVTNEDLEEMEAALPGYEFITGTVSGTLDATEGSKSASVQVTGATPEYFVASGTKVASGALFSETDSTQLQRVVVLDKTTVKALFGDENAAVVGKTVQLGADDYAIVGVVEGDVMNAAMGNGGTIYVPFETAVVRIVGSEQLGGIIGYARDGVNATDLATQTETYVKDRYHLENDDNVNVMAMNSLIEQLQVVMGAFAIIMALVASISLFVGGIGIMNMMLTSVTERIHEIGLRKAIGARRSDITRQFLLESVVLTLVGGLFGIVFGLLGAWSLAALVSLFQQGLQITPALSVNSVLIAVIVCVVIGVVFGYYPARRAARLNPVEALRYQ